MKKKRFKKSAEEIKKNFQKNLATYLLAGFGLVAGLAWNDAIKALIDYLFPSDDATDLVAKFIYAGIVTLFVVIMTLIIGMIFKTEEDEK